MGGRAEGKFLEGRKKNLGERLPKLAGLAARTLGSGDVENRGRK